MLSVTPTTELEAVNILLKNMGEAPINSLSGALPLEASSALVTLRETSREIQTRGWYFNTECITLNPDADKFINIPVNTLAVKAVDGTRVTSRGTRLYNLTPYATGFTFDNALGAEVVLGLEFSDLPESARRYITHRAARIYQAREVGDGLSLREDTADEQLALSDMKTEQLEAKPVSLNESLSVSGVSQNAYRSVLG